MPDELPSSPYTATRGLVYFARMIDKIRLHAAGRLPASYHAQLGQAFDGLCLRFLGLEYPAIRERALAGGSYEELLDWAFQHGRPRSAEEIEIFNAFMTKRGWRDSTCERVVFRVKESGLEARAAECVTMFDYIDLDEGRTPPDFSAQVAPLLFASSAA
jgi:gluconokinase